MNSNASANAYRSGFWTFVGGFVMFATLPITWLIMTAFGVGMGNMGYVTLLFTLVLCTAWLIGAIWFMAVGIACAFASQIADVLADQENERKPLKPFFSGPPADA